MKLYHGTTAEVALLALSHGLKTRKSLKTKGNWGQTIVSNPNQVYLTAAYAPYFAMSASGGGECGIVEIDTDFLDEDKFVPDEDFLEQATRTQKTPPEWGIEGASMETRTRFFRNNIRSFSHLWKTSLEGLGNVAYRGSIPKKAITRVTVFDPTQNPTMTMMAVDPSISIVNFTFLSEKYKALTRWFAGYEVDPIELIGFGIPLEAIPEGAVRSDLERRIDHLRSAGHLGITQVECR